MMCNLRGYKVRLVRLVAGVIENHVMRYRKRKVPVEVAREVKLSLAGIAYGGEAVGRHEGEVVFVAGGIPGEEVTVDLYRERKGLLRGHLREVIAPSRDRVQAPCPYFDYCGGCQWQHISYDEQLALKKRIVAEQLEHIGGFSQPCVHDTLPSPRQWEYRNHVRFSTGRHGHLGFTRPASHRFLAIDRCLISHRMINELLVRVQGQGKGLHQVVMRVGESTGDVLLYPALDTGLANIQHDEIEEVLLGHRFHVSRSAFFQVNTPQAEQLARLVVERLDLSGPEVVVDAYCGVGTFAILLAEMAGRVIGIEESRQAVASAQCNAEGFSNVSFIAGKTENVLPAFSGQVDAVVLDPARAGCAPAVIESLIRLAPKQIVYVSCDPATLARDLRLLHAGGYTLVEVSPVDMFPQTFHIENVAILKRGGIQ